MLLARNDSPRERDTLICISIRQIVTMPHFRVYMYKQILRSAKILKI